MKENELRLNNYYQLIDGVLGGGVCRISTIPDFEHIKNLINSNSVFPIPLTEEWLLKFGFKYSESMKEYKNNNLYFNQDSNLELTCYYFTHSQNIKHVHQLQNLYFALTNEELNLKP